MLQSHFLWFEIKRFIQYFTCTYVSISCYFGNRCMGVSFKFPLFKLSSSTEQNKCSLVSAYVLLDVAHFSWRRVFLRQHLGNGREIMSSKTIDVKIADVEHRYDKKQKTESLQRESICIPRDRALRAAVGKEEECREVGYFYDSASSSSNINSSQKVTPPPLQDSPIETTQHCHKRRCCSLGQD